MSGLRRRAAEQPATLLAAAAMLLSGGLLLHWLGRLTFWRDEWDFLLHRRSWSLSTFLDPFVEHLVAASILIYKVLVSTFGMDSGRPFQIAAVVLFLLSVGTLFAYVRRRIGEWLALAAILPILFLGPSWDDLLFPFQMALFGSVAAGIGALLAMERRSRGGDIAAAALLLLSLLFSDLGIPFVAAATVLVAFDRERWGRAFVVVVPTALWLVWYAGWGHNVHTFISVHNLANLPSYVLDGLASSLAAWTGLAVGQNQPSPLDWGRPLLVLAVGVAAWRLYRLRRPPASVLAALVLLLGFWSLTALNANPLAPPSAGRYQYIGITFIAIAAAELLRGVRVSRGATAAILLVALAAAVGNASLLRDEARGLARIAQQERGGLAALELARARVDPGFKLTQQNSGVDYLGELDAGSYFSAVDAYGSPAYSARELPGAPVAARTSADMVSAAALGIGLAPAGPVEPGSCVTAKRGAAPTVASVPLNGIVLRANGPGTSVRLQRYASAFPVALGTLPARSPRRLAIPADGSSRPWSVQLTGGGPVTACRAKGS